MRLRLPCVVVLMSLLAPTAALANDHVARLFGGYSNLSGSSFNGGHGSVEVAMPFAHPSHDDIGIVVDSSVHGGTDAGTSITKATLLFGLRGIWRPGSRRLVLFAHLLGGFHRSHIGGVATNGRAGGAGGGVDILLGAAGRSVKPGAPTSARSGWTVSNQYDWVRIAGENSVRISAGIGYRYR